MKKTLTLSVMAKINNWTNDIEYHVVSASAQPYYEEEGWAFIGTRTLLIDPPSEDVVRLGMIAGLKKKADKIRAEAEKNLNEVEEEIQKLLALPSPAQTTGDSQ